MYSMSRIKQLYQQIRVELAATCCDDFVACNSNLGWLWFGKISGKLFPGIIFFVGAAFIDIVVLWCVQHVFYSTFHYAIMLAGSLSILICWTILYAKVAVLARGRHKLCKNCFVAMSVQLIFSGSSASFILWCLLAVALWLLTGFEISRMIIVGGILLFPLVVYIEAIYWTINNILLRICLIVVYTCILCMYLMIFDWLSHLSEDVYSRSLILFIFIFLSIWLNMKIHNKGLYSLFKYIEVR